MKHVNTNNTGGRGSYAKVISDIAQDGVCPFCSNNIAKYHKNEIVEKTHWLVTRNMYPYKPTLHHFLLIHKEHIEHVKDLTPEAWLELHEIISELSKTNSIDGGSLMMRFGNTKFTGASVSHLHAHIVQSNPDDPAYDKKTGVLCRIG